MKICNKLSLFYLVLFYLASCGGTSNEKDTGTDEVLFPEIIEQQPEQVDGEVSEIIDIGLDEINLLEELPDLVLDLELEADIPSDVPPANGVVGDPCVSPDQCGGVPGSQKQCLQNIMGYVNFEGGYCSAVCTSDADCDETIAKCVNFYITSYCIKKCNTQSDCRDNYSCSELPSFLNVEGTYCIPEMSAGEG